MRLGSYLKQNKVTTKQQPNVETLLLEPLASESLCFLPEFLYFLSESLCFLSESLCFLSEFLYFLSESLCYLSESLYFLSESLYFLSEPRASCLSPVLPVQIFVL